jgi:hypothetical protein
MTGRDSWARWGIPITLAAAAMVAIAIWRGGLLGLPEVPPSTDAAATGLENLKGMADRAARLERAAQGQPEADSSIALAGAGLALIRRGAIEPGLDRLREGLERAPRDLVIGNAYRMAVFQLRRVAMTDSLRLASLAADLPPLLDREPRATLEAIQREHPSREATLQLALAWVDDLLLFPALEIQAPASVESVTLLSSLLAQDPVYVPALYCRGLNYLHRPARLVWPEARKAAPDAASHDIGMCVAIGRHIGGASPRLVATLALSLGDAFAKEGKPERARSWWQIAQNACHDAWVQSAVRRRFAWRDAEMIERVEAELESRRLDIDQPLTDLSVIWR